MRHALELFQPAFDEEREGDYSADEEQIHDAQRHRELDLKEAFDECHAKGVSIESLQTLLFETGARWMPKENKRAA